MRGSSGTLQRTYVLLHDGVPLGVYTTLYEGLAALHSRLPSGSLRLQQVPLNSTTAQPSATWTWQDARCALLGGPDGGDGGADHARPSIDSCRLHRRGSGYTQNIFGEYSTFTPMCNGCAATGDRSGGKEEEEEEEEEADRAANLAASVAALPPFTVFGPPKQSNQSMLK